MTETEAAYIAGIVDGEGSILIYRYSDKRRGKQKLSCALRVSISNTNKELLQWIRAVIGTGHLNSRMRLPSKRLEEHSLHISGHKTKELMEGILPYLRVKRFQAETALRFVETLVGAGNFLPEEVIKERETLRKQMVVLNNPAYN